MQTDSAIERLEIARVSVRQVLEQWNPVEPARLDASRELLEQAVLGMRDFDTALRSGAVPASQETRAALLNLRQDIQQATRIVDAGSAFHRGLAARLGNISSSYDAGGRLFSANTPEIQQGLQV
jgi:hypothetical protein